ncbi:HTH domain-containing protein [Sporosarcina sp. E16_8]|uniref:helix-turn-helix domain-containing protein n=1 Tax=Sporosarcina sp. E16_8 TaxID=2789295 RepID=UPI001A930CC3|nr:HTH domain-containing protein [Sporosarcina sp. E16_8]MBO0586443.1 HTH domain-containing protein [Sporosarcina sp. E16_8]
MPFEYLSAYKTFESVADMDKSVEDHIAAHYFNLTESERAIVFKLASRSLMYPGASHLKAETIADQVGVSTKTVYRSIKKLAELEIIEKVPGTKLNGIKGASIYKILPFDENVPSEVSQRVIVGEASNDVACPPQSENQSLESFNLLSSKQANNIISVGDELALQAERKKEYMNEYQVTLFDFMHSLPMKDELKDELHKVVLASQINDARDFVRAKDILLNIIRDVNEGILTISSTLRAVYKGAHSKVIERRYNMKVNVTSVEDKASNVPTVPFYNWLVERDGRPCIGSILSINE